ncbi:hypothetical protein CR513_07412, partial [Mucuna pruriens]
MILVPKKDKSWIICMDYHSINTITTKYRPLIPRLNNLLDELHDFDLHNGYHQIGMKEGDALKIKYVPYEWLVMSFKLTNSLSTFMKPVNYILRNDHVKHVRQVLQLPKNDSLYVNLNLNLEKCTLYTQEVIFLGFIVGSKGVLYLSLANGLERCRKGKVIGLLCLVALICIVIPIWMQVVAFSNRYTLMLWTPDGLCPGQWTTVTDDPSSRSPLNELVYDHPLEQDRRSPILNLRTNSFKKGSLIIGEDMKSMKRDTELMETQGGRFTSI